MTQDNAIDIRELEQTTIQLSVTTIVWLDRYGRIRHANNAACEMLQYSYDQLTSMSVFDIDPNTNPKNFEREYLEAIREKGQNRFESSMFTRSGGEIPVELSVFFVRHREVELFCCACTDISLRKQMMARLIESEERIRAIFNNHFQLTGLLDTEGRFLRANQAALDLIGIREDEVIGSYFWDTPWFAHSRTLRKKIEGYVEKAAQGEFIRTEFVLIDKEGKECIFDHSFKPVRDAAGKIRFIVPEARDITDIRKAEKDLKKAYRELKKLKDHLRDENLYLKEELRGSRKQTALVGQSPAFKNVLFQVEQVAGTSATVLILGETGTGKELVAHSIHELSDRCDRPLIKLNCAAIPASLVESELFGHEKGAFTGAHERKIGRFERADKGTLFLDEIGELSIDLQAKLLRVLQESEFERIGGSKTIKVDVRIIAATNRDIKAMVAEGSFREDLYYRLHVFPVSIPPLRERRDDIPLLANVLIRQISKRIGRQISRISASSLRKLQAYHWPGNVRELINVLERAAVLSQGNVLSLGDWFQGETAVPASDDLLAPSGDGAMSTLDELQRRHIINVLEKTKGRIRGDKGAARILGLKPTTLESRMKKLNIMKSDIS